MNAARQELRAAWGHLMATPAAMFLAILTAGFALASTARHMGLYSGASAGAGRSKVVLACPRTNAAKSAASHAASSAARHTSSAAAINSPAASANSTAPAPQGGTGAASDKQTSQKTGSSGLSLALPDFNAPKLSRFISPL
jgi:hypothetical protein